MSKVVRLSDRTLELVEYIRSYMTDKYDDMFLKQGFKDQSIDYFIRFTLESYIDLHLKE